MERTQLKNRAIMIVTGQLAKERESGLSLDGRRMSAAASLLEVSTVFLWILVHSKRTLWRCADPCTLMQPPRPVIGVRPISFGLPQIPGHIESTVLDLHRRGPGTLRQHGRPPPSTRMESQRTLRILGTSKDRRCCIFYLSLCAVQLPVCTPSYRAPYPTG